MPCWLVSSLLLLACTGCDRVFALLPVAPDAQLTVADAADDGGANDADVDGPPDAPDPECFTDSFTATVIDSSHWPAVGAKAPAAVSQGEGVLKFTLGTSSELSYAGIHSSTRDFTNDTVEIEVIEVPSVATSAELAIAVQLDEDNRYMYLVSNGFVIARSAVAGSDFDVTRQLAGGERYLRIRFSGSQAIWESSPDHVNWAMDRSSPALVSVTAMNVELSAGTYQAIASPGGAKLDNFALICAP